MTTNDCLHDEVTNQGTCFDCGAEIENWEPTDAQIAMTYGPTKEPEVAA